MSKKLALWISVLLTLFLFLGMGYLWRRSNLSKISSPPPPVSLPPPSALKQIPITITLTPAPPPQVAPPPVSGPESDEAKKWAQTMISTYPYQQNSLAGIQLAKRNDEVWIIGFLTGAIGIYPSGRQYAGVKNKFGLFEGRLSNEALFTVQNGDQISWSADATPPGTINEGDLVAARMTFADNFGLILEIRHLLSQ